MKRLAAIIWCCIAALPALAGIRDSLVFRIKPVHRSVTESYESDGLNLSMSKPRLSNDYYFFYKSKADRSCVSPRCNDSAWALLHGDHTLDFDDNKNTFTGEGTFRLHYKFTDSTVNIPLVCEIRQTGASELYIDGKLIRKFGIVGTSAANEEARMPRNSPFYIQHSDTGEHVLTILYSNYTALAKGGKREPGFELKMYFFDDYAEDNNSTNLLHKFLIGLFAFFLALSLAHFLLFFADRSKRFNLFYALFLLMVSLTSIRPVISAYNESPAMMRAMDSVSMYFIPVCLFSLLNLVYSLFRKKFNFFYYLQAGFFAAFVICHLTGLRGLAALAYVSLFIATYVGVTIIAIKALRHKYNGANYLGWGVLLFTIFFILAIITVALFDDGFWLLSCMAASILSLPASMTAYLSHDFAVTTRSLKQQLAANEELSRKTLEQEKEKQEILANQNRVLEAQVNERTREIAEKNKVLEHQKKEITDSINYAKRIQQALLPDLADVSAQLPGSFILYLPKDIVSGDFYFFRKKGNDIFIAAADCTGHGVPGALMSMIVHEKLNHALDQFDSPAEILKSINIQVKDSLKQNQGEGSSRDGCDIALCRLSGGEVTFAGAYRPLYVFDKNGELTEIKPTKTAIAGLTPYDQVFEETKLETPGLRSIYMFSDGYADQFGGTKSKKLTTKKFKELLTSVVELPVKEQQQRLHDFFIGWRADVEQIDDVLVIGIVF